MKSELTLSEVFQPLFKGYQKGDEILINSIPQALAQTSKVCSSRLISVRQSPVLT